MDFAEASIKQQTEKLPMCGIAGISLKPTHRHLLTPEHALTAPENTANSPRILQAFAQALAHRGPDGEGFWHNKEHGIGLVHRRLSIIDVSGGRQPITTEDEQAVIVGNGEIYNFKPLQEALTAQGIPLKTGSDIETALHVFRQNPPEDTAWTCHLHGMYALAIYDKQTRLLTLARDPFGIKPLYIAHTEAGIAFASEPSVLTRSGWLPAALNAEPLPQYLNRHYTSDAPTLFRDIERLLPGEVVILQDGEIIHRTQRLPTTTHAAAPVEAPRALTSPRTLEEALATFDTLFTQAVQSHLQSEVPYGLFLSGGIDSTAILLKMHELGADIRTYTLAFQSDTVADERAAARRLVEAFKGTHTEVSFSEEDFWERLPQAAQVCDDLTSDPAVLPVLKLAEAAAKDVTVVLSGEGGDEIFAGYGRYKFRLWNYLTRRPFRGHGDAHAFANLFTPEAAHIAEWMEGTPSLLPPHQNSANTIETKGNEHGTVLLRHAAEGRYPRYKSCGLPLLAPAKNAPTRLQNLQRQDITDWLPDDLLNKLDRTLMTYGLEGRVPMLDDHLAAFGLHLPDRFKIHNGHGKHLVKQWVANKLKTTANWSQAEARQFVFGKKKGFTVPVSAWMNTRQEEVARRLLLSPATAPLINPKALHATLQHPWSGKQAQLFYSLLLLTYWYEAHISNT